MSGYVSLQSLTTVQFLNGNYNLNQGQVCIWIPFNGLISQIGNAFPLLCPRWIYTYNSYKQNTMKHFFCNYCPVGVTIIGKIFKKLCQINVYKKTLSTPTLYDLLWMFNVILNLQDRGVRRQIRRWIQTRPQLQPLNTLQIDNTNMYFSTLIRQICISLHCSEVY